MTSTVSSYTLEDVVPNFLRGEYIEATRALIHLNPELTVTISTGASSFVYLKVFVPWRHGMYVLFFSDMFCNFAATICFNFNSGHTSFIRVPYNEKQLDLRRSLGSNISHPAIKRTFLVIAIYSWAMGKYRSFRN